MLRKNDPKFCNFDEQSSTGGLLIHEDVRLMDTAMGIGGSSTFGDEPRHLAGFGRAAGTIQVKIFALCALEESFPGGS